MDQHIVIKVGMLLICLTAVLAVSVDVLREARSPAARRIGRHIGASLPVVTVLALAACWVRITHE